MKPTQSQDWSISYLTILSALHLPLFFWISAHYLQSIFALDTLFLTDFDDYRTLLGKIFILSFTLSTYLFFVISLVVFPFLILLLISRVIAVPLILKIISGLIYTLTSFILLADAYIFQLFKFHLSKPIFDLLLDWSIFDIVEFDFNEKIYTLSLLGLLLLHEGFLMFITNFLYKNAAFLKWIKCGLRIWCGFGIYAYSLILYSSHHGARILAQQIPYYPLMKELVISLHPGENNLLRKRFYLLSETHLLLPEYSVGQLYYPKSPLLCKTHSQKPPNIVLIMIDSLRADSLNPTVMPNTYRFAQQSWNYLSHRSGGNATLPGLFSLFYSLPPTYWSAILNQHRPPLFLEHLRSLNYELKIFWSSFMNVPAFDQTIYHGIPNLQISGATGKTVDEKDKKITLDAIEFLKTPSKKPFFLNLFYDAAHGYCLEQNLPTIFSPAVNECKRYQLTNETHRLPLYHRYLNAVHFIDEQIGHLLQTLRQKGYLENTLVIITSDHGQEYNDNHKNYWEHTSNYSDFQIKIPLVLYLPHEPPKNIDLPTTSYDVLPSILRHVYDCSTPFEEYSIATDLIDLKKPKDFLLSASYVNIGLISKNQIITLERSGEVRLTDPQLNPKPIQEMNQAMLKKGLEQMRDFFKSPIKKH